MTRARFVYPGRLVLLFALLFCQAVVAQDASTSAIRGVVSDGSGARIAGARVSVVSLTTNAGREALTDSVGTFMASMLPPGEYWVRISVAGMTLQERQVQVEVGGTASMEFVMQPAGTSTTVEVASRATIVDTVSTDVSRVIDEKTIEQTPVNGRRFTDLALLTPGVTQDPRGQTSGSNGDLSFGGIRGFQTSFLVDGADHNNGFFSQQQGRYRAPYQFSNEVVREFRVSSNAYGAESGRAGGAVINVATKSGTNQVHGSAFYYLRDSSLGAAYPFSGMKPQGNQKQWGITAGGPIRRNKIFFFAGWDAHNYDDPNVVRFLNGQPVITPAANDYDPLDQQLVTDAAATLSQMGGTYNAKLNGRTTFLKLDDTVNAKNYVSVRWSGSTFSGHNNVFFDPGNPVTYSLQQDNGTERVRTDSVQGTLTTSLTTHWTSHARLQYSQDLEQSFANSEDARTKIYGLVDGYGRSTILPRRTREHRLHAADTVSFTNARNTWKFGGDALWTWDYNFFPSMFGGEYEFDKVRVRPFSFEPYRYGMHITALRAYAHGVPRYYMQSFGEAASHPDTREYAAFVQDSVRVTSHLGVSLGVRYDMQSYPSDRLASNPAWPTSGRMPAPKSNFAPRVALAYALGDKKPLVVRAGYGWFYTRIPQIYESAIQTGNGMNQGFLFLDSQDAGDAALFPVYPNPLVACGITTSSCVAPLSVASRLTGEIYAFDAHFRTPMVQQASLTLEKEIAPRLTISTTYLHVHGEHLLRAVDVNLPPPVTVDYPIVQQDGTPTGQFLSEPSFATWQLTRTLNCAFPPCINDVQRPIPQAGAINVFQSAASSVYNGLSVSARRRMGRGFSFQLAYTYAKALDDGQDALVAGSPSTVQNPYALKTDRGLSSTDQRQRFVLQGVLEPRVRTDRPVVRGLLNHWRISQVTTIGTGRPVTAKVSGDANGDDNIGNDRLPGVGRNSLLGPDYASTELRISREVRFTARYRLELLAEAFNSFNRDNKKLSGTDQGLTTTAAQFEYTSYLIGSKQYPGGYTLNPQFMQAQSSYIPRQVQLSARLRF